ncbi:MAG: hypothetical protein GY944_16265, partial [bacterium]|nr:hypothetical protein [bacterium]
EAGRDPSAIELTIWPGSYDFSRTFDLDFVRAYTDAGASRVIISNAESQTVDIGEQRDFILRYQEQILSKL